MATEIKPQISLTELKATSVIDVRIGKVIAAEIPAKGKKFIHMNVFFGDALGNRSIVCNMGAPNFTPEDYVGKLIPFFLNLGVKHTAGVESEGMILASTDPETGQAKILSIENANPGDILF